jgi:hypothetical protein
MATKRFGRLPARYSFALNPDAHARFSRCPKCRKPAQLRKFALLIHVEGSGLIVLGKTCRYCSVCELIIAHQDELEAELANVFSDRDPDVVGSPYFVIGTLDRKTWRRGLQASLTLERVQGQAADFRRYFEVWSEPARWVPNKRNS